MAQVTKIDYWQLIRDHDTRPFSSGTKPTVVLLPSPEDGGFDVQNCYPRLEESAMLARRLLRLPLLEAFYIKHASALDPDPGPDSSPDGA